MSQSAEDLANSVMSLVNRVARARTALEIDKAENAGRDTFNLAQVYRSAQRELHETVDRLEECVFQEGMQQYRQMRHGE